MADIGTNTTVVAAPHMAKAASLLGNWAARSAGTGFAATALMPCLTLPQAWPQIWHELWQIQAATWQRQRQLQDNWLQGWLAWTEAYLQARGGNTMTKQIEREFDLIGRLHELMSAQTTDLVGLLENLEINYAYWVNEKLR